MAMEKKKMLLAQKAKELKMGPNPDLDKKEDSLLQGSLKTPIPNKQDS